MLEYKKEVGVKDSLLQLDVNVKIEQIFDRTLVLIVWLCYNDST